MAEDTKPAKDSAIEKVEASDIVEIISKQHPRLFNGVKKEKQAEIVKAFSVGFMQIQKHHSGPLPDAETLEHYSNIIPNGAERIMVMAEKEQNFRHDVSSIESRRFLNQRGIGQIFGFIISLLGIGGGIFLAYSGKETAGLTAIISAMVLLAGAFITGKLTKEKE